MQLDTEMRMHLWIYPPKPSAVDGPGPKLSAARAELAGLPFLCGASPLPIPATVCKRSPPFNVSTEHHAWSCPPFLAWKRGKHAKQPEQLKLPINTRVPFSETSSLVLRQTNSRQTGGRRQRAGKYESDSRTYRGRMLVLGKPLVATSASARLRAACQGSHLPREQRTATAEFTLPGSVHTVLTSITLPTPLGFIAEQASSPVTVLSPSKPGVGEATPNAADFTKRVIEDESK